MIPESAALFLLAGGLVFLALLLSDKLKWTLLAVTNYLSTMAEADKAGFANLLIEPLQWLRRMGRPLCLTGLSTLGFYVIFKRTFHGRPPKSYFLLLALQLFLMLREMVGGNSENAILRTAIFLLLFLVLGIGLPSWIRTAREARSLVGSLVWSGLLLCIFTGLQLSYDPESIVWAGRMLGTTGSAQHAATILALLIVPIIWLFETSDSFPKKTSWLMSGGVVLYFLMWTGSRTGVLILLVGCTIFFWNRFRLWLGSALLAAVVFYFASIGTQTSEAVEHIAANMENTRVDAWSSLWANFLHSPLYGVPVGELEWSENSYLLVAARGGIPALLLACVLTVMVLREAYRAARLPAAPNGGSRFRLMILSFFCSFFVGALFEGYLISNLSFPVFALYAFLALHTCVIAWEPRRLERRA